MGVNIILITRNKERLKETFNKLEKGNHLIITHDIIEYGKFEQIIKDSAEKLGRISGFVHSAGIKMTLPLRTMQPSYYEEMFSVNVIAGFELARVISKKKYISKDAISFVFISSVMGILGQPGIIAYCASKGSLILGVKSIALELASKKIRVNCISLGQIKQREWQKVYLTNFQKKKKQKE